MSFPSRLSWGSSMVPRRRLYRSIRGRQNNLVLRFGFSVAVLPFEIGRGRNDAAVLSKLLFPELMFSPGVLLHPALLRSDALSRRSIHKERAGATESR